jgi:nitrogen fixation protein FixH
MTAVARSRPDGWWYPWIFVGGMGVVIVVNLVLVVFAVSSFSGIATKDHYRKGLAYDTAIEAHRRQAERGWSMDLAISGAPGSGAPDSGAGDGPLYVTELAVIFVDKGDRPLEDLTVRAALVRPTHPGHDAEIDLQHRGAGRYATTVTLPLAGQWDVRVHAQRGDAEFRENRRIFLPR